MFVSIKQVLLDNFDEWFPRPPESPEVEEEESIFEIAKDMFGATPIRRSQAIAFDDTTRNNDTIPF